MKLVLIRYKNSKQLIVLKLGERSNKLCGILSESITNNERVIIQSVLTTLTAESLSNKINFIRKYCPQAYKTGYREFKLENTQVIEEHSLQQ